MTVSSVDVVSSAPNNNAKKSFDAAEKAMDFFAPKVSYRVGPVVEVIRQTGAWKKGTTRDVLDWGAAGGGALAHSMAQVGATRVAAVDANPVVVLAAKRRLESFPRATAVQSLNANALPETVCSSESFDLVVSYQGALENGILSQRLSVAADVCRDGGSIIVASFPSAQLSDLLEGIKGIGVGCAFGFFLCAMFKFTPVPWYLAHAVVKFWLALQGADALDKGIGVGLSLGFFLPAMIWLDWVNVLRLFRNMVPWYLVYVAVKFLLAELDTAVLLHIEMLAAGFTNIRKRTKILFWPYESLGERSSAAEAFWLNLRTSPLVLHIWQGTRQRAKRSPQIAVPVKLVRRHSRRRDDSDDDEESLTDTDIEHLLEAL